MTWDSLDARFQAYVDTQARAVKVRVFLCGPAFDAKLTPSQLITTDIRAYLNDELGKKNNFCEVFFGEHSALISQYEAAMSSVTGVDKRATNLALFENQLANFVDLIVMFPNSPGSFAELGMFAADKFIGKKLLLVQQPAHKSSTSFIGRGPVALAAQRSSTVVYIDYSDRVNILESVLQKVRDLHELKLNDHLLGV